MTTAGNLIDRAYSEVLDPEGEDAWDTLAADITAVSDTLTISGFQEYVADFSIIEIGSELIRTGLNSDEDADTLALAERGFRETDAASHSAGDQVRLYPKYPRKMLLNALRSCIGTLHSYGLYQITSTDDLAASSANGELPDGAFDVSRVFFTDGSRRVPARKGWDYEVLYGTDPLEIQWNFSPTSGNATLITYKTDFTLPTTESDDLEDDCGIPETLVPWLTFGIASYVLEGKEGTTAQRETVARLLEAERIPIGSSFNVGQSFGSLFRFYVSLEKRRLLTTDPPQRTYRR